MNEDSLTALFLGRLEREYLINAQGQVFIDQPGGNLLYAAAAYRLWGKRAGLIARVGKDYPGKWLKDFSSKGLDTRGVRILSEEFDLRSFVAYSSLNTAHYDHPVRHFVKQNKSFPKSLLGYERPHPALDSKKARLTLSIRETDFPKSYAGVEGAHLCPLDYFSHTLMPPALRESGVSHITISAGNGYIHPSFWNDLPVLVNGLSAFLITEKQIRTLFSGRSQDLWEMAETLVSLNCSAVVIDRGMRGQLLHDKEVNKHYRIPPYPGRPCDLTGASSSFSGGFLAGVLQTGDFLQAALMGSVTASLAAEGSGAYYVMESFPGLAKSRLESLAQAVQIV